MGGDQDARRVPEHALDMGPLGDDVGFQIHITRRALWSALRSARGKRKERSSSGYISSLLLIGANPGISPSQIAEALVLDMPNVVQIVRMLAEADLIERRRNPADKRRLLCRYPREGPKSTMSSRQSHAGPANDEKVRTGTAHFIELLGKVRASLEAAHSNSPKGPNELDKCVRSRPPKADCPQSTAPALFLLARGSHVAVLMYHAPSIFTRSSTGLNYVMHQWRNRAAPRGPGRSAGRDGAFCAAYRCLKPAVA